MQDIVILAVPGPEGKDVWQDPFPLPSLPLCEVHFISTQNVLSHKGPMDQLRQLFSIQENEDFSLTLMITSI